MQNSKIAGCHTPDPEAVAAHIRTRGGTPSGEADRG
jgi:hypothetical protein